MRRVTKRPAGTPPVFGRLRRPAAVSIAVGPPAGEETTRPVTTASSLALALAGIAGWMATTLA